MIDDGWHTEGDQPEPDAQGDPDDDRPPVSNAPEVTIGSVAADRDVDHIDPLHRRSATSCGSEIRQFGEGHIFPSARASTSRPHDAPRIPALAARIRHVDPPLGSLPDRWMLGMPMTAEQLC